MDEFNIFILKQKLVGIVSENALKYEKEHVMYESVFTYKRDHYENLNISGLM